MGAETTNGDGFGDRLVRRGRRPATFKSVEPAWNDQPPRPRRALRSGLVFAHIRRRSERRCSRRTATRSPRPWLWMHNGSIASSTREARARSRRRSLAVPAIEGSTDSEVFFFLALTLGLEDDPPAAGDARSGSSSTSAAVHTARAPDPDDRRDDRRRRTCGRSATRARGSRRSLFYSTRVDTLREQHPEARRSPGSPTSSRLVVSEPLGDLVGAWNEVPESHYGVSRRGRTSCDPARRIAV